MKNLSLLSALCATVLLAGCASVTDFFVPPHSQSLQDNPDRLCIRITHGDPAESNTLMTLAGSAAIGWVYDQVVDAGRAEQKRYTAATSGRVNGYIYERAAPETFYPMKEIEVTRYHAESADGQAPACPSRADADKLNPQLKVVFEVETNTNVKMANGQQKYTVTQYIVPTLVEMSATKAKLPSVSWWRPWTWLLFGDRKYDKVDLSIQLGLQYQLVAADGTTGMVTLVNAEFPIEGIDVTEGKTTVKRAELAQLKSPVFELPAQASLLRVMAKGTGTGATDTQITSFDSGILDNTIGFGNSVMTVEVTESNMLGSKLGSELDRAEEARDEQISKAVAKLLEELD